MSLWPMRKISRLFPWSWCMRVSTMHDVHAVRRSISLSRLAQIPTQIIKTGLGFLACSVARPEWPTVITIYGQCTAAAESTNTARLLPSLISQGSCTHNLDARYRERPRRSTTSTIKPAVVNSLRSCNRSIISRSHSSSLSLFQQSLVLHIASELSNRGRAEGLQSPLWYVLVSARHVFDLERA